MLRLNNISKKYQNQVVLNIPDLVIKDGECVGLVGNNGAGKTTCFSLILGNYLGQFESIRPGEELT